MLGAQTIKDAMDQVHTRTQGVQISEIRIGKDSTDEDAVWVYVVVPDDRIEEFYDEWDEVREDIRRRVREKLGDSRPFVYIRMRAASEVRESP